MSNVKSTFTNFKVHTQYSLCEGAIKIDDLADYCKKNKIRSLGLSDSFLDCPRQIANNSNDPHHHRLGCSFQILMLVAMGLDYPLNHPSTLSSLFCFLCFT